MITLFTLLPCNDHHLLMIIIVMSTHCWTRWRLLFTLLPCSDHHPLRIIIVMSTHCWNTMEIIIYIITMQWSPFEDDYHCNEHHPEVKTIFIFYLRLFISKWACYWQCQQLFCSNRYYWPLWWEPIVWNTMEWYIPKICYNWRNYWGFLLFLGNSLWLRLLIVNFFMGISW